MVRQWCRFLHDWHWNHSRGAILLSMGTTKIRRVTLRLAAWNASYKFSNVANTIRKMKRAAACPSAFAIILVLSACAPTVSQDTMFNENDAVEPAQIDCMNWNTPAFFETATVAIVQACLDSGADPNATDYGGWAPLDWAPLDTEIYRVLVDSGARHSPAMIGEYLSLQMENSRHQDLAALCRVEFGDHPTCDLVNEPAE